MLSLAGIDRKSYAGWFEGPSRRIFAVRAASAAVSLRMARIAVMSMAS